MKQHAKTMNLHFFIDSKMGDGSLLPPPVRPPDLTDHGLDGELEKEAQIDDTHLFSSEKRGCKSEAIIF